LEEEYFKPTMISPMPLIPIPKLVTRHTHVTLNLIVGEKIARQHILLCRIKYGHACTPIKELSVGGYPKNSDDYPNTSERS
jgi:hypothetical protein